MKQWLNQHALALNIVLIRMRHHFLATLMMCCVMGLTLALPGILYVVVDNLSRLAGTVQSEPQISLFLKLDNSDETRPGIEKLLRNHNAIESFRFVSKEEAWEQLQQSANSFAGSIEKNPLPDAYFVKPKEITPENIAKLQEEMQHWAGVELAQVDAAWIKRLYAILALGKKAFIALAILLGLALVAIISNTIRLQIVTQREEIQVSKLIGATNRFIRRPFLYAGTLYGLGGGLAAWALLAAVIALFNFSVAEISQLYASSFSLSLPGLVVNFTIIASAVLLGWIGSYIAVSRTLSELEL